MHKNTLFTRLGAVCFGLSAFAAAAPAQSAPPAPADVPVRPAAAVTPKFHAWAPAPPMGWNSWDCFGAGVNEEQTLANADYMDKNLKSHGWSIVTVDIQWYEPLAHTERYRLNADLEMDANGRLLPAANRFPLTKDSRSFKPLADAIHAKGLKFGVHLLRGIPRQAVERKLPVLGTAVTAADVADTSSVCRWNGDMYGVDMSKPGAQDYYDSVFALLASWEIDLVKVDDLSAPYHKPEIEAIRKAIDKAGRPILLSTSPGDTPVAEGAHVSTHANMWRVSGDFWDNWPALYGQFARLNAWTPFRGPGHFPDADMLPVGNIRAWGARNDWTNFTHDEQTTLMTLWSIARSPLILGANLPKNDEFTLSLLTNDEVIAVDQASANNRQVSNADNRVAWVAGVPGSRDKYVALFNTSPAPAPRPPRRRPATTAASASPAAPASAPGATATPVAVAAIPSATNPAATQPAVVSVPLADLGLTGPCKVRDLWARSEVGTIEGNLSATVNSHGAALFRVSPQN